MSSFLLNVTSNGTDQLIRKYNSHKQIIRGLIEVGGDFGGGTLTFSLSLSDGTVINAWDDITGVQLSMTVPTTRSFKLPVVNMSSGQVRLYYTLTGATNPDIDITIGDVT